MQLYRGTRGMATDVDTLSMAAYSAATARMAAEQGGPSMALQYRISYMRFFKTILGISVQPHHVLKLREMFRIEAPH